jgi:hypothetical protein
MNRYPFRNTLFHILFAHEYDQNKINIIENSYKIDL